jgi:uncharacterized membrane protein
MFCEQFVVVFVLSAYIFAQKRYWAAAGILMGCAIGFKQYAVFAIIPFLYQMWAYGDRRYALFLIPLI